MAGKTAHTKAAEKALGLEPIGAETHAEADLRRKWERYFAPLGLALPDVQPPDDVWYRVQAALDRAENRKAIKQMRGGLWRWRFASLFFAAATAGLAAFVISSQLDTASPAPVQSKYIAVVTPEDAASAVIVEVDLEAGTASIRPVGVTIPEGKALQVWTAEPEGSPRPVGLLDPDAVQVFDVSADPGDAFAVSIEPQGGSPTGAPTGEVVYHGTLIAVPD